MSDFFAEKNYNGDCRKPEHLETKENIHRKVSYISGEKENGNKNESEDYSDHFEKGGGKGRLSYDSAAVEEI